MMKEIKEIMELHRLNGGVGILDGGIIKVYNDTFNIYTDEVEYEPANVFYGRLDGDEAFVKVSDSEVVYTFYGDGSWDLDNAN